MTTTLALAALAVILGVSTITALAVVADRNARATAWHHIAIERRWNYEHRARTAELK